MGPNSWGVGKWHAQGECVEPLEGLVLWNGSIVSIGYRNDEQGWTKLGR